MKVYKPGTFTEDIAHKAMSPKKPGSALVDNPNKDWPPIQKDMRQEHPALKADHSIRESEGTAPFLLQDLYLQPEAFQEHIVGKTQDLADAWYKDFMFKQRRNRELSDRAFLDRVAIEETARQSWEMTRTRLERMWKAIRERRQDGSLEILRSVAEHYKALSNQDTFEVLKEEDLENEFLSRLAAKYDYYRELDEEKIPKPDPFDPPARHVDVSGLGINFSILLNAIRFSRPARRELTSFYTPMRRHREKVLWGNNLYHGSKSVASGQSFMLTHNGGTTNALGDSYPGSGPRKSKSLMEEVWDAAPLVVWLRQLEKRFSEFDHLKTLAAFNPEQDNLLRSWRNLRDERVNKFNSLATDSVFDPIPSQRQKLKVKTANINTQSQELNALSDADLRFHYTELTKNRSTRMAIVDHLQDYREMDDVSYWDLLPPPTPLQTEFTLVKLPDAFFEPDLKSTPLPLFAYYQKWIVPAHAPPRELFMHLEEDSVMMAPHEWQRVIGTDYRIDEVGQPTRSVIYNPSNNDYFHYVPPDQTEQERASQSGFAPTVSLQRTLVENGAEVETRQQRLDNQAGQAVYEKHTRMFPVEFERVMEHQLASYESQLKQLYFYGSVVSSPILKAIEHRPSFSHVHKLVAARPIDLLNEENGDNGVKEEYPRRRSIK